MAVTIARKAAVIATCRVEETALQRAARQAAETAQPEMARPRVVETVPLAAITRRVAGTVQPVAVTEQRPVAAMAQPQVEMARRAEETGPQVVAMAR